MTMHAYKLTHSAFLLNAVLTQKHHSDISSSLMLCWHRNYIYLLNELYCCYRVASSIARHTFLDNSKAEKFKHHCTAAHLCHIFTFSTFFIHVNNSLPIHFREQYFGKTPTHFLNHIRFPPPQQGKGSQRQTRGTTTNLVGRFPRKRALRNPIRTKTLPTQCFSPPPPPPFFWKRRRVLQTFSSGKLIPSRFWEARPYCIRYVQRSRVLATRAA